MTDWLSCIDCGTIYEYDSARRIAECPYCAERDATIASSTVIGHLELVS